LFLITPLFIGLLNFAVTMPQAEAANNSAGFCRKLIAQRENVAEKDVPTNIDQYKKCVSGYNVGYANPNNNDTSAACPTSQAVSVWYQYCIDGYKGGQKDKKAEAGPAPSSSNVQQAAEKACQPYKDQKNVSQTDKDQNFKGCVAGYTGQKGSKDSNDACRSFSGVAASACLEGYNNAANGQAVTPGSGATVTPPTTSTSSSSGTGDDSKQLDCDTQFDNPLTWIICPVVDTMAGMVDALDSMITNQMSIETGDIFCSTGTCTAYYTAWQSFRNIALGLVAIAGLVIVISQALGFEILDAYTIRKSLPRILVAVVGITLSWQLMKLAVEFTNDLGFGIRRLIYFPFTQLKDTLNLSFNGANGFTEFIYGSLATAGAALGGATVWMVAGGIGVLFSYVGTAALAVLIAIIVLILRQVVIIMLMLTAPIAIISYVFPNTQRVYKFWWEAFSKALLMFPIRAGFIAAGRVFSAITISNGGVLNQLIGFMAYFAPYFMIPATFKLAGGALRQIGGFVNDRSRGGFDRLRNYRSNQAKSRLERVRGQGLYRGANRLTKGLNKLGFYTWNADEQLPYDMGSGTGIGAATGPLGRRMFGRQAADMAGQKAIMRAEQTAKAVDKAKLHYTGAWAALGMLDGSHAGAGLTAEGRKFIDNKYGIRDNDGNITGYRQIQDGDYEGLRTLGEELDHYGQAGSGAAFAGKELQEKAGILTSFRTSMDTQRAGLQEVAALSAAKDGKLSGEDMANIYNATAGSSPDPVAKAFAGWQLQQMESSATNYRQDTRTGKGIRIDGNGKAYSVFKVGAKVMGEDGREVMTSIGVNPEAYDAALTMKGGAATNVKAESIKEMAPTLRAIAEGEHTEWFKNKDNPASEIQDMRQTIAYQATNIYSDPSVRAEWAKLATGLLTDEEMSAAREAHKHDDEHHHGQEGAKPPEPPPTP
jgi:hypothetical protein